MGSTYTAVLYVLNGKQTSSSFNDHAEALRFQELANRTSPAKALEVWGNSSSRGLRWLHRGQLVHSPCGSPDGGQRRRRAPGTGAISPMTLPRGGSGRYH